MQGELFPLDLIEEHPPDITWTDAAGFGTGSDGLVYVIKDQRNDGTLCINEWLGAHLTEAAGLAAPPCRVLKRPDGKLVFGSRWEGGVLPQAEAARWLVTATPVLSRLLPAIFALDLFVQNQDRHIRNLLIRETAHTQGLLVYDFSRAFLHHGWPSTGPGLPPSCNTVDTFHRLGRFHDWDWTQARGVLDTLSRLSDRWLEQLLGHAPPAWLGPDRKVGLSQWWQGEARQERIDAIRRGLDDGSML